MTAKRTLLASGAVIGICLAIPGVAGAATVTIGSPLMSPFSVVPAGTTGTTAMVSGPNIASPVDGTVTNWHTEGFTGNLRARVIQLVGDAGTATATGPFIALTGGSTDQSLNLPIAKGEVVGFDNTAGSDVAKLFNPSPTYTFEAWTPALSDGGAPQPPAANQPIEFAYNATVRYCLVPKVKGKKIGAARTTLANAGCALGKVKKKKGSKGKFVHSQSVAPGTSLADGAAVNVKAGKKPKKK